MLTTAMLNMLICKLECLELEKEAFYSLKLLIENSGYCMFDQLIKI